MTSAGRAQRLQPLAGAAELRRQGDVDDVAGDHATWSAPCSRRDRGAARPAPRDDGCAPAASARTGSRRRACSTSPSAAPPAATARADRTDGRARTAVALRRLRQPRAGRSAPAIGGAERTRWLTPPAAAVRSSTCKASWRTWLRRISSRSMCLGDDPLVHALAQQTEEQPLLIAVGMAPVAADTAGCRRRSVGRSASARRTGGNGLNASGGSKSIGRPVFHGCVSRRVLCSILVCGVSRSKSFHSFSNSADRLAAAPASATSSPCSRA